VPAGLTETDTEISVGPSDRRTVRVLCWAGAPLRIAVRHSNLNSPATAVTGTASCPTRRHISARACTGDEARGRIAALVWSPAPLRIRRMWAAPHPLDSCQRYRPSTRGQVPHRVGRRSCRSATAPHSGQLPHYPEHPPEGLRSQCPRTLRIVRPQVRLQAQAEERGVTGPPRSKTKSPKAVTDLTGTFQRGKGVRVRAH
jgi:hypothetical protein